MNEEKMREEFEAWQKRNNCFFHDQDSAWGGYQAACENKQKAIEKHEFEVSKYVSCVERKLPPSELSWLYSLSGSTDRCENIDADIDKAMKEVLRISDRKHDA